MLVSIYVDGEKMFKGGGCVLYIYLFSMGFLFHWLKTTSLMSEKTKFYIYIILLVLAVALLVWFTYYCIKDSRRNKNKDI